MVLLILTGVKWHYMAVDGAGAGAVIMDKGRAGAEKKIISALQHCMFDLGFPSCW